MNDLVIMERQNIVDIADAIRNKTGNSDEMTLADMVTKISEIENGSGVALNSLNFALVGGTSAPQLPTENTIWINTDTEISNWVISDGEPENPVEGLVWLQTGTISAATFNALKQNNITIAPNFCKQYISNEWVIKQAKTFQNDAWADWYIYIYKTGAINSVIDDLALYAYLPSTSGSSREIPAIEYGESSIKLTVSGGASGNGGSYFTEKTLDLTNKNSIKIKVLEASAGEGAYVRFGATQTKEDSYVADVIKHIVSKGGSITEPTTLTIDISELSGEYYLFVTLYATYDKTITFSEWWVE